jgi:predicted Fe-Mo cluster-binding NifX family protein
MKIAIASDDQFEISSHFGMTKGFVIAEIEDNKVVSKTYKENTFTGHAQHGGEGHNHQHHHENADEHNNKHATILSALSDCQAVISNGMGMRIYNDLKSVNITPFITQVRNVDIAIDMFVNNKLDDNPGMGCNHHA